MNYYNNNILQERFFIDRSCIVFDDRIIRFTLVQSLYTITNENKIAIKNRKMGKRE